MNLAEVIQKAYILLERLFRLSSEFLRLLTSLSPPEKLAFCLLAFIGGLFLLFKFYKILKFFWGLMKREEGIRADYKYMEGNPLGIPKKKLVSKEKKRLRTKTPLARKGRLNGGRTPPKGRRASVAEVHLQNFLEEKAISKSLPFLRIPDEVLKWIYANPDTPGEVIAAANEYIRGRADAILLKPLEGSKYCLALIAEVKTDAEYSKLRASQKEHLRGLNFIVPRSKEEIEKEVEDFDRFQP